MLDYCKMSLLSILVLVAAVSCQTRPKSDTQQALPKTDGQAVLRKSDLLVYVRTPSVIYFDPNDRLVDVTETLEILSFDGATFGWTIPLKSSHPEFLMRENILQFCIDGKKRYLTSSVLVRAESLVVQNYRDYGSSDCRGTYLYEILFNDEVVMTFHLNVM